MMTTLLQPQPAAGEKPREGDLYKSLHISGQTFPIYYGYYEELDRNSKYNDPIPIYPDFHTAPQYDAQGHPFVTAMQDACSHYKGRQKRDKDCASCAHFRRGEALIGICRCPQKKCSQQGDAAI